jgi:hypothetical protein
MLLPDRRPGQFRSAASAGYDAGARRGGVDVEAAGQLEGLQELTQPVLVARFDDEVQGVLALDDRFTFNLDTVLADIRAAQIIQQPGSRIGIMGRAMFCRMLMPDNEECHGRLRGDLTLDSLYGAFYLERNGRPSGGQLRSRRACVCAGRRA